MKIAMTSNSRPVALKDDGTWEYLNAQGSSIEKLRRIKPPTEVLELFKKLFTALGIEIVDSGEKFTCISQPTGIKFEEGIDEGSVDFTLKIYAYQVDRVIRNVEAGYKDPLARFRLIREFFGMSLSGHNSPLNNPIVTNPIFRKLINSKNIVHLYLTSPDPEEESDATYTLFFINDKWHIASGLVGEPERTFRLSEEDAFALHTHFFSAGRDPGVADLPKLAAWYMAWRESVSVKAA